MVNAAKFTIDGSASEAANGDRSYDTTSGATLTVAAEASPSVALSLRFEVYDAAQPASPLATFNAPTITWDTSGIYAEVIAPTATADITMPVTTDAVSYIIRCIATRAGGSDVYDRTVSIRTLGLSPNLRKTTPGETGEYRARGFSDDLNELIDVVQGIVGGGGHSMQAAYDGGGDWTSTTAGMTFDAALATEAALTIDVAGAAQDRGLVLFGDQGEGDPSPTLVFQYDDTGATDGAFIGLTSTGGDGAGLAIQLAADMGGSIRTKTADRTTTDADSGEIVLWTGDGDGTGDAGAIVLRTGAGTTPLGVRVEGGGGSGDGLLRIMSNNNYVGLTVDSPDNTDYTWPDAVGTAGQVMSLQSVGAGVAVMEWADAAVADVDETFIYDSGAVAGGNVYDDLETALAAAIAYPGMSALIIETDGTVTGEVGLDLEYVQLRGGRNLAATASAPTITWAGTTTWATAPAMVQNLFLEYTGSATLWTVPEGESGSLNGRQWMAIDNTGGGAFLAVGTLGGSTGTATGNIYFEHGRITGVGALGFNGWGGLIGVRALSADIVTIADNAFAAPEVGFVSAIAVVTRNADLDAPLSMPTFEAAGGLFASTATGGSRVERATQTAAFTVSANTDGGADFPLDSTGGGYAVTLPLPSAMYGKSVHSTVRLYDVGGDAAANPITFVGTFVGATPTIDVDGGALELVPLRGEDAWAVLSDTNIVLPTVSMQAAYDGGTDWTSTTAGMLYDATAATEAALTIDSTGGSNRALVLASDLGEGDPAPALVFQYDDTGLTDGAFVGLTDDFGGSAGLAIQTASDMGGSVRIRTGNRSTANTDSGEIVLWTGDGTGTGSAGALVLRTGDGTTTAPVQIESSDGGADGLLRIMSGNNYAGLTVATPDNTDYTLPDAVGIVGQVLQIDSLFAGGATLSWATVAGGGGDTSMQDSYTEGNEITTSATGTSGDGSIQITATLNDAAALQIDTQANATTNVALALIGATAGAGVFEPIMDFYEGPGFSGSGTHFGGFGLIDITGSGLNALSLDAAAATGANLGVNLLLRGGVSDAGLSGGVIIASGESVTGGSSQVSIATGDSTTSGGTGQIDISTGAATLGTSGAINILTASGVSAGDLIIRAGSSSGDAAPGGTMDLFTGNGGDAVTADTQGGQGGDFVITLGDGGDGTGTEDGAFGGYFTLTAGNGGAAGGTGTDGQGGYYILTAGDGGGTDGDGGYLRLVGGEASGTGLAGDIEVNPGTGDSTTEDGSVIIRNGTARAKALLWESNTPAQLTGFKAGATGPGGASLTYVLPVDLPTVGQVLTAAAPSGGESVLSWSTGAGGGDTSMQDSYSEGNEITTSATGTSGDGSIQITGTLNTAAVFQIDTSANAAGGDVAIELHGGTAAADTLVPLIDFYEGTGFSGTGTRFGGIGLVDVSGSGGNVLAMEGNPDTGAGVGVSVRIAGGAHDGAGAAGGVLIYGGDSVTGAPGPILIDGGAATTSGSGAAVAITSGLATLGTSGAMTLATPSGISAGNMVFSAGSSSAETAPGGTIDLFTGSGGDAVSADTAGAPGGDFVITLGAGGDGTGTEDGAFGGYFTLTAGDGGEATGTGTDGQGGYYILTAGNGGGSTDGAGGYIRLVGGEGTGTGDAGDIELNPGTGDAAAQDAAVIIRNGTARAKALLFESNAGGSLTGFKAAPTATGIVYALPSVDPTVGQVLTAAAPVGGVSLLSWADDAGALDHSDLTGIGTDDHHAEAHTIASHSDTTATGPELNTLTDGSDAGFLHVHSHTLLDGVGADDHHDEIHTIVSHDTLATGAELTELTDGSTTTLHAHAAIAHSATTGQTANDHHDELHTIASHSDTTATGPELDELTDGSTTALHGHAPPAHSATTGQTANDHHNELHTIASHSDTVATGAQLNELVTDAETALHRHQHKPDVSGLLTGGVVSIAVDPTEINITAGSGIILDWTDPDNPVETSVTWTAFSDVPITAVLTENFTSLYIDENGDLQQNGGVTASPANRRLGIVLSSVVHNGSTIEAISHNAVIGYENVAAIHDYINALGPVNAGNQFVANAGANLEVDKSSGITTLPYINHEVDPQDPTNQVDGAETNVEFLYHMRDGSGGFTYTPATDLDPGNQDDGSGTLDSIGNNRWTVKRVYWFGQIEQAVITYGQANYASEAAATAAILTESPELDPSLAAGTFVTAIVMRGNHTDSTDATYVAISTGTSGGGGVTTDPAAIHIDHADEFTGALEKLTPVGADRLLIEDSADSQEKKYIAISDLPAIAHSATTGQTADDHHAEIHTIVSHDTDATGAELTELTDGSVTTLHSHAGGGAGDFLADGTIPMTGDFDGGGNDITNVALVDGVDVSAIVSNATHTGDVTGATVLTIAALAVDTAELAADAVDGSKIADDSIDSEHYVDLSIDTAHLALLAVDTGQLAADAVDGTKIEDDAVDTEHLAADAVDSAAIASGNEYDDPEVTGQAFETPTTVVNTATTTIDLATGNKFYISHTLNITTLTMSNAVDGQTFELVFEQDAGGTNTLALPSNFALVGGETAISTTGDDINVIVGTWYASAGASGLFLVTIGTATP